MKTYAYDAENRLISLTEGISTTTYTYNGDGDRVSQTVDGVTTTYVNDTAAPLTMLLAEITGTDTIYYLHGLDLVAQNDGVGSEYFAYDGLGSVRQVLDSAENVLFTQTFDPYGNLYASTGTDSTSFGFTGEQTDSNGLVFLRARYYNPYLNQFIQPDPIVPNPYQPWEWNLFTYSRNNPINFTDPSGKSICYNPLPASCQSALLSLHAKASIIKTAVESGTLEPVEGFAQFADMSKSIFQDPVFKSDIRDMMWAITLVLDDFDANRGFIWRQASPVFGTGASGSSYFIGQNWLPYRHNPDPEYNPQPWCDPENPNNCVPDQWIHSLRGDWNTKYWDKTANQAYHFWFYVAVTFFDGRLWAVLANNVHDFPYAVTHYDFSGSPEKQAPPPPNVPSQPDRDLAVQGMNLGSKLAADSSYQKLMKIIYGNCDGTMLPIYHGWTDTGDWIRFHLK